MFRKFERSGRKWGVEEFESVKYFLFYLVGEMAEITALESILKII